jgi:hypothetical protein
MTRSFEIYDNLVDKEMSELFYNFTMESKNWFYGRAATVGDTRFWGQVLYANPGPRNFFVDYIEAKFKAVSNLNCVVQTADLNGQTSGQPGGFHRDVHTHGRVDSSGVPFADRFLTLIYYVNSTWDDPRGSTILERPGGIREEVKFVPGRILVFPSAWLHYGDCPESNDLLRITCALKLEILE